MDTREPGDDKQTWWKWHCENAGVYQAFERFTFEAIQAGRKYYSAWDVVSRIRWHLDIDTKGDEFKINNNFIAYYARLFMARHPEHVGFFRIRELKNK